MSDVLKEPNPPEIKLRNFTDFIEITQAVPKRPHYFTIVVTAEQARSLAAGLLKAADEYERTGGYYRE